LKKNQQLSAKANKMGGKMGRDMQRGGLISVFLVAGGVLGFFVGLSVGYVLLFAARVDDFAHIPPIAAGALVEGLGNVWLIFGIVSAFIGALTGGIGGWLTARRRQNPRSILNGIAT
jgi:hypothetical protein